MEMWKSQKPISTFPPPRRLRRDELISPKTRLLWDTHSEGNVTLAVDWDAGDIFGRCDRFAGCSI
jgi:hypothetical protein